jgi:hypothetical protein
MFATDAPEHHHQVIVIIQILRFDGGVLTHPGVG